jgi:predicted ATPase
MRLKYISITGYRSLYDVNFTPGDLTVLTGPNNSGKTNFVEALDFLAETYRHGLEVAINRKGGLENIIHRRMRRTRRSLSFRVEASMERDEFPFYRAARSVKPSGPAGVHIIHQFTVVPLSQRIDAEFRVSEERLEIKATEKSGALFHFTRTEEGIEVKVDEGRLRRANWIRELGFFDVESYQRFSERVRPTDLMLNVRYDPIETWYTRAMGSIRLYQLVPLECRRPGVPTPNAEVDTHGSNLPALVSFLRKSDPSAWQQVIEAMQRIVPELTDIKTDFTPDRRLALQFVERGVRRPWSAEDISDGTIQALGMYTAIFDPRASLILIEEPENSVHPWIIRNFIDACRAAGKRQIVLTTHSPALLEYLNPNEISVVWKRHGRTFIMPLPKLDATVDSSWSEGSLSIFDMLDSGLIPQAVPGDER